MEAFRADNRRVSLVSFGAFSDGVVFHAKVFDSGPINDRVDLFHFFDGPVFSRGRKKRDGRESEVG